MSLLETDPRTSPDQISTNPSESLGEGGAYVQLMRDYQSHYHDAIHDSDGEVDEDAYEAMLREALTSFARVDAITRLVEERWFNQWLDWMDEQFTEQRFPQVGVYQNMEGFLDYHTDYNEGVSTLLKFLFGAISIDSDHLTPPTNDDGFHDHMEVH